MVCVGDIVLRVIVDPRYKHSNVIESLDDMAQLLHGLSSNQKQSHPSTITTNHSANKNHHLLVIVQRWQPQESQYVIFPHELAFHEEKEEDRSNDKALETHDSV
jgi:hypothetical protein